MHKVIKGVKESKHTPLQNDFSESLHETLSSKNSIGVLCQTNSIIITI